VATYKLAVKLVLNIKMLVLTIYIKLYTI